MSEKCGKIQQTGNTTNKPEGLQIDRNMIHVTSQENTTVLRKRKDNCEYTTGTFDEIESRLKSLEGDKESLTQIQSEIKYLSQQIDQLENKF